MFKKNLLLMLVCAIALGLGGCAEYEQIPSGTVGKIRDANGFEETIRQPGVANIYEFWWHTKRLVLLQTAELAHEIKDAQVLCQDKMNFRFSAEARFAIDRNNESKINTCYTELTPQRAEGRVEWITSDLWYNIYCKAPFMTACKSVISKYKTMEVGIVTIDEDGNKSGINRDDLNAELFSLLQESLANTPVTVKFAGFTNLDYPDEIEKAIKAAKETEIEIQKEQAFQQKRLVEEENKEALAQIKYRIDVLDALKIADSNKIIGDSLSLGYLWWHQLDILGEAAQGPNNWGFIPYDLMQSHASDGLLEAKTLDEQLGKRINSQPMSQDISQVAKDLKKDLPDVKVDPSSALQEAQRAAQEAQEALNRQQQQQ